MKDFDFYAYLLRMKYIKRWALMRSTSEENIMEHSWEVAVIAHSLSLIKNELFGGKVDEHKTVCLAIYHETSEVVTGDLPTPIKYFNGSICSAYKELEKLSSEKLISKLPEELQNRYAEYVLGDPQSEEYKIMKAADRICAYIKCVEELKVGNKEFLKAKESIGAEIFAIEDDAVKYFCDNILPTFEKTLDELEM